ncbi:MAG TPA: hypothetical protein VF831_05620 [Anaerolineales bacterium]
MKFTQVIDLINQRFKRMNVNHQVRRMAEQVEQHAHPDPAQRPVIVFNASTRLVGMSLNSAFSLLTSLALRLQGVPVIQFTCQAGMSYCVLGTSRKNPAQPPPCKACIAQSRVLYSGAEVSPFTYQPDRELQAALQGLTLQQLQEFSLPFDKALGNLSNPSGCDALIPLGRLVLPSVRWVLRRHSLLDDEPTRFLLKEYILSAHHVTSKFSILLSQLNPIAVVVFNGQFFPEATVRWISQYWGIRSITHEVGLQPFSAFFTTGEATAYPLTIPDDFELDDRQNARLNDYLEHRFQGNFSMAGIHFWPEMKGLDASLEKRMKAFNQVVPVFTNVIFDTSQPHSNVLFTDMFAWLDLILQVASNHPETMFIIRAHPDEDRPGKESQESVRQWADRKQVAHIPNILFIPAAQKLSSYALIQQAKFVMIYNSTIGLEASLMGAAVLCAGRSRFTQLPTVFFPASIQEYAQQLEEFLSTGKIFIPPHFQRNARQFLYYQLYRSSLPFSEYLEEDGIWPGFVKLRQFKPHQLSPASSPTMKTILAGILENGDFLLDADL